MITRFITEVTARINPFAQSSRAARLFLSQLPSNARQSMRITTKMLPRESGEEGGALTVKFKDGKELKFDITKMGIKDVTEEVDRHARILSRQEALMG